MLQSCCKAVVSIAVAASLLTACSKPAWQEVAVPEAGFRISMRGNPVVEKHDLDLPIGRVTGHWYSTELKGSVFGVGYADYPKEVVSNAPPQKMLSIVRESWIKRIQGKQQGDGQQFKLEGHPGMEFVATGKFQGRDAYLRGRLYLVGTRLFQIVVFGDKQNLPLSDINQFMDSFKLTPIQGVNTIELDFGRGDRESGLPLPQLPEK
jgi:hypothetical protein